MNIIQKMREYNREKEKEPGAVVESARTVILYTIFFSLGFFHARFSDVSYKNIIVIFLIVDGIQIGRIIRYFRKKD